MRPSYINCTPESPIVAASSGSGVWIKVTSYPNFSTTAQTNVHLAFDVAFHGN
jgi:hypothetical protein